MTSVTTVSGGVDSGDSPAADRAANARAIHNHVLVLDSHVDVLLPSTPRRYYLPDGDSRASLEKLIKGGVDALVLSVAVGPGPDTEAGDAAAREEADERLAAIRGLVAESGGRAAFATTAGEVERLRDEGRIAVILGFLNARALGKDIGAFDHFYQAGVRIAALTHAGNNAFTDSSRPFDGPTELHGGLSALGREAVRRFNDLGVLVDVSQLSSAALAQTLELTRAPVVASHSNVRALADNPRNLSARCDQGYRGRRAAHAVHDVSPPARARRIRGRAGVTRPLRATAGGGY
jgi:membrane dipeptidase